MGVRFNHLWLAMVALCGVCFAQTTRPGTAPALDPRIEKFVGQLAAEDWQTRQKAQDALVEYGLDIRPRLNAILRETKDEEVRTRIEAALRQIEENRTTGASL